MKTLTYQSIHQVAKELLKEFGNIKPSDRQLRRMTALLSTLWFKTHFSFNPRLTARQIDCLYWAAQGKSSKETGEIMQIQTSTVDYYRKVIKRKLSCASMAEAVFKGLYFNYIQQEIRDQHQKEALYVTKDYMCFIR